MVYDAAFNGFITYGDEYWGGTLDGIIDGFGETV